MTVYFNGQYIEKDQVRISPDDRGFLFADGIYEVIRAYNGKLFRLDAHMARLARGLRETAITGADPNAVAAAATELIKRNKLTSGSATVYVQITRGASPRTHYYPEPPVPPTVYLSAGPMTPKGDAAKGVAVITLPDIRWARCDIKSVSLLPNVMANQQAHAAGAIEAIFVRDGVALEGSSSSVFAVLDGEVRTAPVNNYVLPSITQAVVVELCREHKIPYKEMAVFQHELARVSEVFLASTTLEVMPVTSVDGKPVAGGKPGPVAQRLRELFQQLIA
jgi:D-alanine transaminase